MTLAIERRASPRHATTNNQLNVQIMDWTGLRVPRAILVDFSTEGALILTDKVLILHQPIEVRIENAPETGWIEAEAVRFGRAKEVGIRFYHPCPRDFFSAAARGIDSARVAASDEETLYLDDVASEHPVPPEN
jgi:hypothetical protein